MLDQAIITYCICDEVTRVLSIKDDPQCRMNNAEVMTFAIMSATIYGGNYRNTRLVVKNQKYFSYILSYSRLIRRIHKIPEHVWLCVFHAIQVFTRNKNTKYFIVDSFPVKAYENMKSFRAKIFSGKKYHGYTASKKQYFFGIKVHMLIDEDGIPLEFSFTPASVSDNKAFQNFNLNLPENSMIFADKAYTNYKMEDLLKENENIELIAKRKRNLKRQHSEEKRFLLSLKRNRIETVFSSITSRFPRSIKAKTEKGFCLKVLFFILAYMVNILFPLS